MTVVIRDGIHCLSFGQGTAIPFSQSDTPLRSVGAGWRFHQLHTLFAPLLLMELENEAGQRATWFFDSTARYVANNVADLDPFFRALLARRTALVMDAIMSPDPGSEQARLLEAFFRIEEAIRLQITASFAATFHPPARVVLAEELPAALPVLTAAAGTVAVSAERVRAALAVALQARLLDAARDGELTWPGLVDGAPLPCRAGLCLSDFLFAYRFEEPGSGLPFLVVATMHKAACLAVFLPSENLLIARDATARGQLGLAGPNLPATIADFLGRYGDTFGPYLRQAGPKPMACSMRERHIGHQVWNELSGLENLTAAFPANRLPMLLPFGGDLGAVFGPLDRVFPEFAGRTRQQLRTHREVIEFAHREGLVLARFSDDYVSAGLRERILRTVRKTDEFHAIADRHRGCRGPVILIGLRVENRTAADLPDFLLSLMRCIAAELPGATVVLDGQNGSPSFAGEMASRSPAEAEGELCRTVAEAAAGLGVAIEVASGKPVVTSIAWSALADGFIAFWGAGLAKYRWIANKPGLVVSNRDNLTFRPDLHIYDDPAIMADPAPITFVDPAIVTDDPGAAQLIPLPDPSFANFRLDEAAFLQAVRAFLAPWKAAAATDRSAA